MRVRKNLSGTPECPRLNVFRSNAHIHAQIIDDVNGNTLAAASSVDMKLENGGNIEAAKKLEPNLLNVLKKKESRKLYSTVAVISTLVVLQLLLTQLVKLA